MQAKATNYHKAGLAIRLSLASMFLYAAVDSIREPAAWQGYIPSFLAHYISSHVMLGLMAFIQLTLVALLLWGRYIRVTALASAALLTGIIIFNLNSFLITFRDIGLVGAALALYFLDEK